MINPSHRPRAVVAALLAGTALTLTACSSSGSKAASPGAGTNSTGPSVAQVAFSSPEQKIPTAIDAPTPVAGHPFSVGFLSATATDPSLQAIQAAVATEIKRLGGTLHILDAQVNLQTQVSQAEQLIIQKVNAIITTPISDEALAPSFKKARAAGIAVTIFGNSENAGKPEENIDADVFVGSDIAAYNTVKTAAAQLGPGGKVALLGIAAPIPELRYFTDREGYWAEKFGFKVLGRVDSQSNNVAGAQQATQGILGKYADTQAIFTYNDTPALGAGAETRASGKKVLVYGQGGSPEGLKGVANGTIAATYAFDLNAVGKFLADTSYLKVVGKTPPAQVMAGGQMKLGSQ